jgi:hypothetical protein
MARRHSSRASRYHVAERFGIVKSRDIDFGRCAIAIQ